jgi:secreted trypsin-like serine protease
MEISYLNEFILKGDSGSPLIDYSSGKAVIVGIVSRSICGFINFPAIFIRVSNYIDWINKYTS